MRFKSNREHFKRIAREAQLQTAKELDKRFRERIEQPYYWDGFEGRTTYRQNGEVVVGALRNIRDTGSLAVSQDMNIKGEGTIVFNWDGNGHTPVVDVYFGRRTATSYIPGRAWVDTVMAETNLSHLFIDKLKSLS